LGKIDKEPYITRQDRNQKLMEMTDNGEKGYQFKVTADPEIP
jgi:hypothetical protein